MQKKRISYFTDVSGGAFIGAHLLRRSASISVLLEFVDSLLKVEQIGRRH